MRRFSRGNQPVKCRACGKLTNDGGSGLELCPPCEDWSLWENSHNDNDHKAKSEPDCLLCQGVPDPWKKVAP